MKDKDGDMFIRSNSVWVLMDLEKQQPVKILDEMQERYEMGDMIDMEYLSRKIKLPELPVSNTAKYTVEKFFLDSNGHMNNAWFVRLAQTVFPSVPDGKKLSRICVEYKKQARLGDVMILDLCETDDGFYVNMRDEDNISYAILFGGYKHA